MNILDSKRRTLIALTGGLLFALNARAAGPVARPTLVFTIDVRLPNATAFRIERDITSKLQRTLKTMPDLLEAHATASYGRGQLRMLFDPRVDAAATATEIRNRIDQIKTTLPREAGSPLIGWRRDTGVAP